MFRSVATLPLLALLCVSAQAEGIPIHLWHEPEWFEGVSGSFAYWTGEARPSGAWGIAGPGISAEWTQGGESEWNSIGAAAAETRAVCHRDLLVPRAGRYRVWVRHVDHRGKKSPFKVELRSGERLLAGAEMGNRPAVPVNDEYMLYWGFSFGWSSFDAELPSGPLRLRLVIDRAGEAWRQVDALLLTTDRGHEPVGREKPAFAYLQTMHLRRADGATWRGAGLPEVRWPRHRLGGRDFSLWTGVDGSANTWGGLQTDNLSLPQLFHTLGAPPDIRDAFRKTYPRPADTPLIHWPGLLPGVYLGFTPDLSPGTPLRRWLERTRTPFHILTNYAAPKYDEKTGPATFAALTGPLREQFLGYIHGEAIGTPDVNVPAKPLGPTRGEHLTGLLRRLREEQARSWGGIYRTRVGAEHRAKSIPCLSVESTALAHAFYESGSTVVGYEADATNVHVPMRVAFLRGAARQYGGAWLNYASGNFGDACNYFTQEPRVPRGAKGWWHSKYAVTDGVSAGWYRKMYYLNYLSGASAVFWEQGLENQWLLPGPGTHPVGLSPFGRCTEEFQAFVARLPDRGEPCTPVAFLLGRAHGYEPVNYHGKMLQFFGQNRADLELRELFNVAWHPSGVVEGRPAAPDVQSLPCGVHGNLFDVLIDRPERGRAIFHYPVLWAAGDVDLSGAWPGLLKEYVEKGGTLVVNVETVGPLPASLTGLTMAAGTRTCDSWRPVGGDARAAVPFEVRPVQLAGAKVLALAGDDLPLLTRHAVGKGAVLVTLVPRLLGRDERAHPALPYLMNAVSDRLLPVEVRRQDGSRLQGEVLYQVNRTGDGYLVLLMNNRGVDKTQHGVARVDRRAFVDLQLRIARPLRSAREMTAPRDLEAGRDGTGHVVRVRVHPGDVQVVALTLAP